MNDHPTSRQLSVLRFVAQHLAGFGWAPTVRDVCRHFGWASTRAAHDHLEALRRKGLLERGRNAARALSVTAQGRRWLVQHPAQQECEP